MRQPFFMTTPYPMCFLCRGQGAPMLALTSSIMLTLNRFKELKTEWHSVYGNRGGGCVYISGLGSLLTRIFAKNLI